MNDQQAELPLRLQALASGGVCARLSTNVVSIGGLAKLRRSLQQLELDALVEIVASSLNHIFVLAEDPRRHRLSARAVAEIGPSQWRMASSSDVQPLYDELLYMGNWILLLESRVLNELEVHALATHTAEGMNHLLQLSGATLAIASLEDDQEWLVCWRRDSS